MEFLLEFITWAFAVFGITTITTQSYILHPMREQVKEVSPWLGILLSCPLCFSFWGSLIISVLINSPSGNLFVDGCVGSGLIWFTTLRTP